LYAYEHSRLYPWSTADHEPEGESLMKLYVDTNGKHVTVTKDPTEKVEQNGRQKTERNTGRLSGRRRCSSWTTTAARSSPSPRLETSQT
jgi:hypothetical protein